ncbi:MAG TPA: hypothetical protein VGH71_09380 [Gammaproteobacteria bacterium]|jgi:hypothetical protein
MYALRNRRFRRRIAGGLVLLWLFTVLACATDQDAVTGPANAAPTAQPQAGPNHHGDVLDDGCCQLQSSAVASFDAVKLPHAMAQPAILPAVLLLLCSLPSMLMGVAVAPERYAVRRRYEFFARSLQPQAPPR